MTPARAVRLIRRNLTPDLLAPRYRRPGLSPSEGHCAVALPPISSIVQSLIT